MNIDRLRFNTPVLVKLIREEFNLSYKQIAMIFNVKPETVVSWEFEENEPNEDIVSAMILAYKWVKFWNPIKFAFGLITGTFSRHIRNGIQQIHIVFLHLIRKSEQIKFKLDS